MSGAMIQYVDNMKQSKEYQSGDLIGLQNLLQD